ncbi:flavodoxin family protein [Actinoplanes lobatus]|uniref:Flavodoxin family protein n=1 Tax=Actinoplanes lobatus TaxID=113568 RepID=A0A7W7MHH8_9ACTN|nr:NAD(P)H-dependent oxidoreductase [Actinoplanes lobatus]MBB4750527.1 NAD(P)H dehydrogenase (quinone) [Actinoplanes lobatus]GGN90407.1 flavodoxin family protein [Actinoplanes lobatus]GIE43795.1 flavodoxin family protein [Actinoplanes lobatus]
MSQVHVVYAHPGPESFTREVLDAFVGGLSSYTVSDLYGSGFQPVLSAAEYARLASAPVPCDVAAEQELLDAAEVWAFVYPVWWADCPAMLKGWFDRVWTAGWAYKPGWGRVARRAVVLCTAGHPVAELEKSGVHQAMRTTMVTDRIGARASSSDFVVLGGSVLAESDPAGWASLKADHLARAASLARPL